MWVGVCLSVSLPIIKILREQNVLNGHFNVSGDRHRSILISIQSTTKILLHISESSVLLGKKSQVTSHTVSKDPNIDS